ncbi:helix-turn-helix domain-containing protein [Natronorarus salvus]|uniref:helix-turn-helix domain-containing protein n=1 Tax=Natronorarus salvus TaxID=3117733 RepID=UPI002F262B35
MATIAEFRLPVEGFALGETIQEGPIAEIEIERVAAHGPDHVMPYVWVSADDQNRVEDLFAEDETLDTFELISETEEGVRLYRMDWVDKAELLVNILTEQEGVILSAVGSEGVWNFRALFPERDALSRAYDYAEDRGIRLDITAIYEMNDDREGRFGLSESQHEALTLATERGYYDVPRNVSLEELADDLDISHQSLSERLRRAQKVLNVNTVLVGEFE